MAVESFEDRASALIAPRAAGRGQPPKDLLHAEEQSDLFLDLRDLGLGALPHVVARPLGTSQGEQLLDLPEGEAKLLGPLDKAETVRRLFVVLAVAGRSPSRFFEQAVPLVKPHRFDANAAKPSYLSDRHRLHGSTPSPIVNPVV